MNYEASVQQLTSLVPLRNEWLMMLKLSWGAGVWNRLTFTWPIQVAAMMHPTNCGPSCLQSSRNDTKVPGQTLSLKNGSLIELLPKMGLTSQLVGHLVAPVLCDSIWWPAYGNHMLASSLANMPRAHLRMFKIGMRPRSSEKVYRDAWTSNSRIWCLLTSGWCGSKKGQSR